MQGGQQMEQDGRPLWETIVRITDASGEENIRSLRIALFILLRRGGTAPLRKRARGLTDVGRSLLPGGSAKLPRAEKNRFLFYFPHKTPSNTGNLLPLVRAAERKNLLGGIVAAGEYPELAEFAGRVPIVTLGSVAGPLGPGARLGLVLEARRIFRRVVECFSKDAPDLAMRIRGSRGVVLADAVRSLMAARAFAKLLEEWSPCCTISTSDLWPAEYQLAAVASGRAVPSAIIQHGSLTYYYWPFAGTLYVVWGEEAYTEMLALGAPAERLVMGGMPVSDPNFQRIEPVSKPAGEKPLFVFMSQTNGRHLEPDIFARYARFLNAAVPITPFVHWKIKLHPSEDRVFYQQLNPEVYAQLEFYPQGTALEQVWQDADVVGTLYSTSGLQAMMAGRPLVIPLVSPRMREVGFPRIEGALFALTPEQMRESLQALISDPGFRARQIEVQDAALSKSFVNQGCSASRIVDALAERFVGRLEKQAIEA
jgi:hypothetical protein